MSFIKILDLGEGNFAVTPVHAPVGIYDFV